MGTISPLTYFLNGDKIEPLKIILSPCLVNISDGDKISIEMFFEWRQNRDFENYLVPMLSKFSDGDKIPIDIFFEWGQDRYFENYLVPMPSKYF